ncbi:hypothetical protein J7399_01980 [Shimia sp. R9_1]|uniref:hypothetical protein n=1 Tax=Shimia sp. R9_1 TaxID=2821111 RepID=UPI001ADD4540|nr:hypothetical protein [Shimia sp. R9_1]MBO9406181.1 hypothetical protein [Shimia sp. R9_1]
MTDIFAAIRPTGLNIVGGPTMRKKITVRNVDEEAIDMLAELREEERRFAGAIVSDAIREYWGATFEEALDEPNR